MMGKQRSDRSKVEFDEVFKQVPEFGHYQIPAYFGSCLLILPIGWQIACLVFTMGTPSFHCTSSNSTCPPKKCCDNCTSYKFDGPFTSIVSEWNLIRERAHLAAIAQSVFVVGMLVGSFVFGAVSDSIGRRKTIFLTSGIMSARWLVAHDRLDDAHALLLKYAGNKGSNVDSEAVMRTIRQVQTEGRNEDEKKGQSSKPLDLFRTKKLRRRTLIVFFTWFGISMSFYGFLLYVANLSGNLYVNFFLLFLVDLPHTPVSWFLIHKFGRRIPFALFLLIGGCTCLLTLAVKDHPKAVTAITIIGKFFCSAAFSTVYLYTSELFPTVIRNIAIGASSTCARVGAITAPFIVMLAQFPGIDDTLPIVIIGITTITVGVLSLWLPETLNAAIHQTIEEVEAAPESYAIPCTICNSKHGSGDLSLPNTMQLA